MKLKIASNQVKTQIMKINDKTNYNNPEVVDEQAILLIEFLYANIPGVVVKRAMERLNIDYKKYVIRAELNSQQNAKLIAENNYGK